MKVLELLVGKKMSIPTDMQVNVELEIKNVTEKVTTTSVDLEPSTSANDWWPAQATSRDISYIVEFTNGAKKIYNSIEEIEFYGN